MHLFDERDKEDQSGLDLVPRLFPTRSIVVSASEGWLASTKAIQEKGAIGYLAKTAVSWRLRSMLDVEAGRICASRHPASVHWRNINPSTFFRNWFPEDELVPDDEANDIIIQLFPDAKQISIQILRQDRSNLTTVPRPRSLVLHVQIDNLQPMIAKIARRDKIKREIDNFRAYIHGHLGGDFYPSMENQIILWDMGGATYKYVGQLKHVQLLSDFYQLKNQKKVKSCLEDFFAETWSPHYQPQSITECDNKTLFDIYCEVWGKYWYDQLCEHLRSGNISRVLLSEPKSLVLDAPNPVLWLTRRVRDNTAGYSPRIKLAVTHGDLHADNLLVDAEHNIPWVIDFERTGRGHILQDFVELESDIVNRLVRFSDKEYHLFYQLCLFIAQPSSLGRIQSNAVEDSRLHMAFNIISDLRQLAYTQTGIVSTEEYLWGLLFNTLFRTKLLLDQDDKSHDLYRTLMLASVLCHRLDHINEQESLRATRWPPPNWPAFQLQMSPTNRKKNGSRINQNLTRLRKILIKCYAFRSDLHLQAVFVTPELIKFRAEEHYAETPEGRIEWIIQQLLAESPDGSSLFRFLQELIACCDDQTEPRKELENFIRVYENPSGGTEGI
jgi:hypothetical protein